MTTTHDNHRRVTAIYWAAWPSLASTSYFQTKSEARAYVAKNGGGAIRKGRRDSMSTHSILGDTIDVASS